MPLKITPRNSETQSSFVSRCMGDTQMNNEFPKQAQRAAVCYQRWESAKKSIQDAYEGKLPIEDSERSENYIQKAFNQDKPLNEATLGEYSEAMHTSWKRDDPFRLYVEKFLGENFTKLARLMEELAPYRANLFRYALKKTVLQTQIISMANFSYEEDRKSVV